MRRSPKRCTRRIPKRCPFPQAVMLCFMFVPHFLPPRWHCLLAWTKVVFQTWYECKHYNDFIGSVVCSAARLLCVHRSSTASCASMPKFLPPNSPRPRVLADHIPWSFQLTYAGVAGLLKGGQFLQPLGLHREVGNANSQKRGWYDGVLKLSYLLPSHFQQKKRQW